ncbi:MAG: glutamyl-tRNA reductase [Candidatus Magnetoglobus multicellularis str. Araruama]|uniref:Glutamyl-tRNA reductase n=1 Tax=Candidatus Magnetoglobus multicellularis str. Araruama TaxID=890399 RepID=A0A1V1PC70_9BACT|nr:MAG: glutamyl-tRNA reductase [Candidatus Magnetoglobus multicellularis str. Araruama]
MQIILMGLNHKTASIDIRERLAFTKEDIRQAMDELMQVPFFSELCIISTCNRVEIIVVSNLSENQSHQITNEWLSYLSRHRKIDTDEIRPLFYIKHHLDAVRHLFRVASSLDSMIIGEPQILGQIKESYRHSVLKKSAGVLINRLLHRTFSVAKRVRSETGIGDHAVSISYAAIELGRKIFGSLHNKPVMLIGAGEMAELAVEHLVRQNAGPVYLVNRTFERGLQLAKRFNGEAIRFDELLEQLIHVDIVISSTGASECILNKFQMKKVMKRRKQRSIFFIDIAVPRDIDPDINQLENAYLYDIDDLQGVIDVNLNQRKREALRAERIIDEAVIRFEEWLNNLDVVPTIKALRNKIDEITRFEIDKTCQMLQTKNTCQLHSSLERMANAITNKILHDPIQFLKGEGFHKDRAVYLDFTQKLFRLD